MTVIKYVGLYDIEAHLELGWLAVPETSYFHHADYAILMEWRCKCPIREPHRQPPVQNSLQSGEAPPACE